MKGHIESMVRRRENKNHYELLCNMLIAVLVNLKLISQSLVHLLNASDGFFSTIMLSCYAVFLISTAMNFLINREKRLSKTIALLMLFIIIFGGWYLFSLDVTGTNYIQFLAYVILPVIVAGISKGNAKMLSVSILIVGMIALPAASQLIILDYRNSLGMDTSYAFLPTIIAAIFHFIYFRKESSKMCYVLYVSPAFYLVNLLHYGVRGPIFCIAVTLIAILFFGPKRKKINGVQFFLIIGILIVIIFLSDILFAVQSFFEQQGISWYFLDKTVRLLLEDNLLHGRQYLIQLALEGFINSLCMGKGLNSFYYFTGYLYPHNFLVQFLYEGGIIIFLLFSFLFISGTKKVFDARDKDQWVLYMILFCVSVPYYFISASIWTSPLLWLFVGYLINVIGISGTTIQHAGNQLRYKKL